MTTIFGNPGSTEPLCPLHNRRDDSWEVDPERRLRFPFDCMRGIRIECMRGIRAVVGHEPFVGTRTLGADSVVLVTARPSNTELVQGLTSRRVSFEVIGDAVAPRGAYEAVYEGHRQGRKL